MSPDTYTDVTRQSCGQNFMKSCMGTVIGLLLFIAAIPLLWWNEHRSLEREQVLTQGERTVVTAEAGAVNPQNEGKLVYLTGEAATAQTLNDPIFGITVTGTLRLQRTVEMYQWEEEKEEETKKEVGGGSRTVTTYTYKKTWSDDLIDSSDFEHPEGHQNPATKPYESTIIEAGDTHVGAFSLPPSLQGKLTKFTPYTVAEQQAPAPAEGEQAAAESEDKPPQDVKTALKASAGGYYRGKDPATPQIGDARITFATIPQGPVSLVARQVRNTFEPFGAGNQEINLIETGTVSAVTLFQHAKQQNVILTWVLRAAGALMMVIGIAMFFGPFNALANIIPFIGNITEAGTGCAAFGIGAAVASAVIAFAWIAVRPLVGIPLLVVTAALIYLVFTRGRKRKQAVVPSPESAPVDNP